MGVFVPSTDDPSPADVLELIDEIDLLPSAPNVAASGWKKIAR